MDLGSATEELYAGAPDDFVERRKALVAEARSGKDRPLATAIGKLRRPTKSAWLVNLLAREEPDQVTALLELGQALQAAQAQPSAPELRRLSGDRQKALAAATRRAAALGEANGYTTTEAVRQEVTQTLQAALVESDVAEEVRRGVVTEAHSYGGFGVFGFAAPVPDAGSPEPAEDDQPNASADDDRPGTPDGDGEAAAERQQRTEAEQRLQEAEASLSAAVEDADAATGHADALADRVESLRAELAEAEEAEATARRDARAARKRVGELEKAVDAARKAYDGLPA